VNLARRRALPHAVATGAVLILLVAIAFALGRPALFGLLCAVVVAALLELLDALRRSGRRPVAAVGVAGGLALLGAAYGGRPLWILAALAGTVMGALALALRPGRGATPASDAAWTILAVTWIAGGASAAVLLLRREPGGLALVVSLVAVVAASDTAAFVAGTLWGRRGMAPSISPAKTWEGFAAGLGGAVGAGLLAGAAVAVLSWAEGAGLGLLCGVCGPIGDLAESLVKREIGVKDSGRLLPGHGGLLDRVDAMLFCAPVVLAYLWLLER
jgi:phosphatidate cytidylyltransferase